MEQSKLTRIKLWCGQTVFAVGLWYLGSQLYKVIAMLSLEYAGVGLPYVEMLMLGA